MMTMTEGENHILQAYRDMTKTQQELLDHAAALIVRQRLVSDQTVKAMGDAIKAAYKKSSTITSRNLVRIIADGQTVEGMNRNKINGNKLY